MSFLWVSRKFLADLGAGINNVWEKEVRRGRSVDGSGRLPQVGMRLKDWILKGGNDEGRQLAYLFSWLCSTGVFPVNTCWCCRLGYSWRKES